MPLSLFLDTASIDQARTKARVFDALPIVVHLRNLTPIPPRLGRKSRGMKILDAHQLRNHWRYSLLNHAAHVQFR